MNRTIGMIVKKIMALAFLTLFCATPAIVAAQGNDAGFDMSEAQITIVPRDNGQVREYRVNGILYMIEIVPSKGPSYYLVDTDGDGNMETRRQSAIPTMQIPRWTILRW